MLHYNKTTTYQNLYDSVNNLTHCSSLKILYFNHGSIVGRSAEIYSVGIISMSEMMTLWGLINHIVEQKEKQIKQNLIL